MKNIVKCVTVLFIGLILTSCSFGDFFINKTQVRDGLIQRADAVVEAEEKFFDAYWVLNDGTDTKPFISAYNEFKNSALELDRYFNETKFASSQKVFIDEYKAYYKPFVDEYLDYIGDFVKDVEKQKYFAELDKFTVDFVDIHNKLTDTINKEIN